MYLCEIYKQKRSITLETLKERNGIKNERNTYIFFMLLSVLLNNV